MLACFRGFDCPLRMQAVGQRIVNDIHVRVGEQRFITSEGARDVMFFCKGLCASKIAAGDRVNSFRAEMRSGVNRA